jgi:hypothetical protein
MVMDYKSLEEPYSLSYLITYKQGKVAEIAQSV